MDINQSIKQELTNLDGQEVNEILGNFGEFKQYLAGKVEIGEKMGLSHESLTKATQHVASYLANHEEPRNREEQVLMELWKSASPEEQKTLASVLLKVVQ
ncbi:DUF3243 domain-containing protein [Paenibacillus yanchengensis]|uniref:DUF3243 domain-containing protein n=1 Tax=Paenibacillus yanchengensis TaxID=2035833 RepID=A0ABW4YLN6_9BACL